MRFACNGGCPKDRFAVSGYGEPGQHYLCPGYKEFFHHVEVPMATMAGLLRANRAPAELMRSYASQDARRGRNAPCSCGRRPQMETLPRGPAGPLDRHAGTARGG